MNFLLENTDSGQQERHPGAKKEYREAMRINQDDAVPHSNLGNLLTGWKRCPGAEKEYSDALRIEPDNAEVHYYLDRLLSDLKRYPEAGRELEEAINLLRKQDREKEAAAI